MESAGGDLCFEVVPLEDSVGDGFFRDSLGGDFLSAVLGGTLVDLGEGDFGRFLAKDLSGDLCSFGETDGLSMSSRAFDGFSS